MALAAGDSQMVYEEERVYEAAHGRPASLRRYFSHMTSKDAAPDVRGADAETGSVSSASTTVHHASTKNSNTISATTANYRYLEWNTELNELSKYPEDIESLPDAVTKVVDPFCWSGGHKNIVLTLCCASTFVAAYTAGAYTSGFKQMEPEFGLGRVALLVGLTLYATGFSIAPMMLAPLSEVCGSC